MAEVESRRLKTQYSTLAAPNDKTSHGPWDATWLPSSVPLSWQLQGKTAPVQSPRPVS